MFALLLLLGSLIEVSVDPEDLYFGETDDDYGYTYIEEESRILLRSSLQTKEALKKIFDCELNETITQYVCLSRSQSLNDIGKIKTFNLDLRKSPSFPSSLLLESLKPIMKSSLLSVASIYSDCANSAGFQDSVDSLGSSNILSANALKPEYLKMEASSEIGRPEMTELNDKDKFDVCCSSPVSDDANDIFEDCFEETGDTEYINYGFNYGTMSESFEAVDYNIDEKICTIPPNDLSMCIENDISRGSDKMNEVNSLKESLDDVCPDYISKHGDCTNPELEKASIAFNYPFYIRKEEGKKEEKGDNFFESCAFISNRADDENFEFEKASIGFENVSVIDEEGVCSETSELYLENYPDILNSIQQTDDIVAGMVSDDIVNQVDEFTDIHAQPTLSSSMENLLKETGPQPSSSSSGYSSQTDSSVCIVDNDSPEMLRTDSYAGFHFRFSSLKSKRVTVFPPIFEKSIEVPVPSPNCKEPKVATDLFEPAVFAIEPSLAPTANKDEPELVFIDDDADSEVSCLSWDYNCCEAHPHFVSMDKEEEDRIIPQALIPHYSPLKSPFLVRKANEQE